MYKNQLLSWHAVVSLVLLHVLGCTNSQIPAHPASGRVVFKSGSPVQVGSIELRSRDHRINARGEITRDGRFVLSTYEPGDGAVAGTHDCVVVQMVMVEELTKFRPSTDGVVHPRFGSYATSALQVEITPNKSNNLQIIVEGLSSRGTTHDSKRHVHQHSE